ncbi:MAG: hypothetical protein R2750_07610 [Bacteroidales bacterium]
MGQTEMVMGDVIYLFQNELVLPGLHGEYGIACSSRYWESQPCLSADGRSMYFVEQ